MMRTMQLSRSRLTWFWDLGRLRIGPWCAVVAALLSGRALAEPVPHHFAGITVSEDQGVALSLGGSVSNLIPGLTGSLSNQFLQMFDMYVVETSTKLPGWTRAATLLRTNSEASPLQFHDPQPAAGGPRFYRTTTNHLLTWFLKPTGPYPVGVLDRVMTDPARTNLYRYTPKTNAFMVTIFYPAEAPAAGMLPDSMWPRRIASDPGVYSMLGLDGRWAKLFATASGHRFREAPLAARPNRFPVLFFSHGLTFRLAYSQMAEELASHGYVVITADHPDCFATEFPDGRYLKGGSPDNAGRFKDMEFLVNEAVRMNTDDTFCAGRLDLELMGILGASYGGIAAEMCRRDPRLKCVALVDGNNFQLPDSGIGKPFLAMSGTASEYLAINQALFDRAKSSATFLAIEGADHRTFWDEAWGPKLPEGRSRAVAMNTALVWFFATRLKGEMPTFPSHPEIVNVQRK
jgi:hypothetical protein